MGDDPDGLSLGCLHRCLYHEGAAQVLGTAHGDPNPVETYKDSSTKPAVHAGTSEHCHDRQSHEVAPLPALRYP
jgi:hypothetical protein